MRRKLRLWHLLQKETKMYSFFLFVLSVQVFSSYADTGPCPFNKECTCYTFTPAASLTFDYVNCITKDGKLPQFDSAPEGKYRVNYNFVIDNADLRVIPAKHFAAFEYIGYVQLRHKSGSPLESAEINWDDAAFDGVELVEVITSGLDGLIPVPAALKNSGFKYLYVYSGRTPISVKDDSFKNSPSLELLSVYNTTIHEIKPNAFAGLEDKLQLISFEDSDIRGFVSLKDALKNMKKLSTLDLSYNSITEVKSDSFPEITLHYLHLSGNPIEKVDKKSFTTLKELRVVSLSSVDTLTSADLATFSGLNTDMFTGTFYYDKSLKSVIVSDAGEFAKNTTFDFGATGVETIDNKVEDLMDKYSNMFIFFDQNTHLKCEGLEWMSKIECPTQMWIDGSKCADKEGQKLVDYLKSVDPASKCKEGVNLPRHLQMRGNLAQQERQHKVGHRRQF